MINAVLRNGRSLLMAMAGLIVSSSAAARAENPIVPGQGLCDPDIRIYDGRAYLYGSHDAGLDNKTWKMDDWWVWSSADLVNWKLESVLKPEDTYYGKPMSVCWATTAAMRAGKYYFYFSRGRDDTGVVVGDSPVGPWKDTLGKPLLTKDTTPTKTSARDPAILQDTDGVNYIVFGKFDFYIARLNDDMISLAEPPRLMELDRKNGPIGEGKTDDKPYLHRRGNQYYLSWGCFYATGDSPYGPFKYKGSIVTKERTDPTFRRRLLSDRHGTFFDFNGQSYFACNDLSSPGASNYFRNTLIAYVHYRDNGEIEPIHLTPQGVGGYDAKQPVIQAEDYFLAEGAQKRETPGGGFGVTAFTDGGRLAFPNVANLAADTTAYVRLACARPEGATIEIHSVAPDGPLLGRVAVPDTGGPATYQTLACPLKNSAGKTDLHVVVRGKTGESLWIDWISF